MSPARARTRLAPADRRQQLLECAVAACAEHGVARFTHAHVARRAAVSVAAVHAYFRTRQDLVRATLQAVETPLLKVTADTVSAQLSAEAALMRMVREFDQVAREHPERVMVWLDWSTGFRDPLWPDFLKMYARLLADVRTVLNRGKRAGELSKQLDAGAAARLFVGGGRTVALTRFAGGSESEIRVLIQHLVSSVMGIGR